MRYNGKLRAKSEVSTYSPVIAPETEERLHILLNALDCMDARAARDLEILNRSGAEEDLKEFVRQGIISRHQERRLPLQEAAEELRAQFQAALPDDDD